MRSPHTGPGLLMVEGRQYPFSLESLWKSQGLPQPGLAVDIEFGQSGQIVAITVVPESQLAGEQTEATQDEKSKWSFSKKLAAKFGRSK